MDNPNYGGATQIINADIIVRMFGEKLAINAMNPMVGLMLDELNNDIEAQESESESSNRGIVNLNDEQLENVNRIVSRMLANVAYLTGSPRLNGEISNGMRWYEACRELLVLLKKMLEPMHTSSNVVSLTAIADLL